MRSCYARDLSIYYLHKMGSLPNQMWHLSNYLRLSLEKFAGNWFLLILSLFDFPSAASFIEFFLIFFQRPFARPLGHAPSLFCLAIGYCGSDFQFSESVFLPAPPPKNIGSFGLFENVQFMYFVSIKAFKVSCLPAAGCPAPPHLRPSLILASGLF